MPRNWVVTWGITAILVALFIGSWEISWRARGFRPTVSDDARLWGLARSQVKPDSIVLVGNSRMHADVHPQYFKEVSGATPIQLAVNGGMSYLVLQHLAGDTNFQGTVLCDLTELEVATGIQTSLEKTVVDSYMQQTLAEQIETQLQVFTQKHFSFASPQLSLPALLDGLLHGKRPIPTPHYHIAADRALLVDFSLVDPEKLRQIIMKANQTSETVVSPEEFVAHAHRFEILAEQIENRGGRVIFVRLPTSGPLWLKSEQQYPKAEYWDAFARQTHFPTIHFRDYPELQIECLDYSHLDMRDAPKFTRALATVLMHQGWVKSN